MTSEQRYISKELTHFIGRDKVSNEVLYQKLCKILKEGLLTTKFKGVKIDTSKKLSEGEMIIATMICFCDIPLSDMGIHIKKYGPFGLSFTKDFIVKQGGYPVFYVAKNARSKLLMNKNILEVADDAVASLISDQVSKSIETVKHFDGKTDISDKEEKQIKSEIRISSFWADHVLGYIKLFDHTLPDEHPDNVYFEREWRVLGNVKFGLKDIQRILIPKDKDYAERFRKDFPEYYGQLSFTVYPDE
jgi:hypothetical protein